MIEVLSFFTIWPISNFPFQAHKNMTFEYLLHESLFKFIKKKQQIVYLM